MTKTKKLVYGGQRGLEKAVAVHAAKGWEVVRSETIPRGKTDKKIYIAYLKRESNNESLQNLPQHPRQVEGELDRCLPDIRRRKTTFPLDTAEIRPFGGASRRH